MKTLVLITIILFMMSTNAQNNIYDISIQSIDNELINLNTYKGKYILFVNVASYCGYTSQYSDLQKLDSNILDSNILILNDLKKKIKKVIFFVDIL